ncbi:MAG TPA: OsmC family protein [Cytophagaceae bacterium]|nr:OsmC family protein [Cytophagaceae bacterium]
MIRQKTMAQMKAVYLGELRTEAEHIKSGNKIIVDAPTDNNGKGEAFSPTDLVCSALASCMITIMGIVANRENLDISGLRVDIEKVMAQNPRKIAEIKLEFMMPASVQLTDKQKEVLKRAAHTCPVALSLDPSVKQTVNFNF